jgi:hypothetical protein
MGLSAQNRERQAQNNVVVIPAASGGTSGQTPVVMPPPIRTDNPDATIRAITGMNVV